MLKIIYVRAEDPKKDLSGPRALTSFSLSSPPILLRWQGWTDYPQAFRSHLVPHPIPHRPEKVNSFQQVLHAHPKPPAPGKLIEIK